MTDAILIEINDESIAQLATSLCQRARHNWTRHARRYLLGIAGVGGSGKSTLAIQLMRQVMQIEGQAFARLVPMDGFHLTNEQLDALGRRRRKGAPDTFDADAYIDLLHRARPAGNESIRFPVYDRTLHEPVFDDDEQHSIGASVRLIVTEGNYLLLDEPPWTSLAGLLDECWWLGTPVAVARGWIVKRHIAGGRDRADAEAHFERADLPNAQRVLARRRRPDCVLAWPNAVMRPDGR